MTLLSSSLQFSLHLVQSKNTIRNHNGTILAPHSGGQPCVLDITASPDDAPPQAPPHLHLHSINPSFIQPRAPTPLLPPHYPLLSQTSSYTSLLQDFQPTRRTPTSLPALAPYLTNLRRNLVISRLVLIHGLLRHLTSIQVRAQVLYPPLNKT
jgi:hypothetical protein